MINLSATLALASILSPTFVHHSTPSAQKDTRVIFSIHNRSETFRDVMIDGCSYTVLSHHAISVKAPVGTVVFADSRFGKFRAGDPLLTVTPALRDGNVDLQ